MKCTRPITIPKLINGIRYYDLGLWTVPCGKCLACRKEQTKSWALRMIMETLEYKDNLFLTLTYDDEHLRILPNGRPTLYREDLTKFWKRLRKDLGEKKIKYYACGEYGDNTLRPHYHAIVFGLSIYDQELIQENWTKGFVQCDPVELACCNYVAGYVQKKLYGDDKEMYQGVLPPYSVMSKGIGKRFVDKNKEELLRDGFIRYRGMKLPIPRYFWKLMEEEDSRAKHRHAQLANNAIERQQRDYARLGITDDFVIGKFEDEKLQAREISNNRAESMFSKRGKI